MATPFVTQDPNDPRFAFQYAGSPATRDIQLSSGESGATLTQGQNQSQNIAQSAPSANVKFAGLIGQLLQRHQQLGTGQFAQQQFNASDEQARRVFQTPQDLIGAAPGVQGAVRGAQVSAVQPTISGAQQGAQTFREQLGAFGSAVEAAQAFSDKLQAEERQKVDDAKAIVEFALSQGGSSGLEALMNANPDLLKTAGLDAKTVQGLIPAIKRQEQLKAPRGTEGDRTMGEINRINSALVSSKRGGQFVDGNVYLEQRRLSSIPQDEFDSRFASLLSPSDRQAYGVSGGGQFSPGAMPVQSTGGNATEQAAAGYALRAFEADKIINDVGSQFVSPSSYAGAVAPNIFKGADRQKFEQAERNFINAVLRRESGAAIAPSEFENARAQYFPQPGDGEEVLRQKAANRDTVYRSLAASAGQALTFTQAPTEGQAGQTSSGIKYQILP